MCSDNELELGNEGDDELAVRAQRLAQGVPPLANLRLALAEKGPHEAAESLGQGGVGDVAFVLVELARREQAARRDERLVEFVHHRRFADAGIAGNEHELRCAIRDHSVEGAKERLDLMLPAVELLRDEQLVPQVVRAEQERLYAADPLPLREALPQVGRKARSSLVAILGILGEELHHHRRKRRRDVRDPLGGRRRLAGDVAMHPFHRIGGGEGQFAGSIS